VCPIATCLHEKAGYIDDKVFYDKFSYDSNIFLHVGWKILYDMKNFFTADQRDPCKWANCFVKFSLLIHIQTSKLSTLPFFLSGLVQKLIVLARKTWQSCLYRRANNLSYENLFICNMESNSNSYNKSHTDRKRFDNATRIFSV
jgi:hypothetical protein